MLDGKIPTPKVSEWHPSLAGRFNACAKWRQHLIDTDQVLAANNLIRTNLAMPGTFQLDHLMLGYIADTSGAEACLAACEGDMEALARALPDAVSLHSLGFRALAGGSPSTGGKPVILLRESLRAAGPAMLSHWERAELCAQLFIEEASKPPRFELQDRLRDGWGYGTHEAFLVYLFAQAFFIETDYVPQRPLVPEYQALLEVWRSRDVGAYREAMRNAAEFHLHRRVWYLDLYEDHFHAIFPVELLAVQALRRAFNLPEVKIDHLLIDKPWSLIREPRLSWPHPLALPIEKKLREDFPGFRVAVPYPVDYCGGVL